MATRQCMKCMKYLLFAFNFLFLLCGIILIIAGTLAKTELKQYVDFAGEEADDMPVFIIIIGVITFVVAFLGCCGAMRESVGLLITFSIVMCLVFILEIGAVIGAYAARRKIKKVVYSNAEELIELYNDDTVKSGKTSTLVWDKMQTEFECCAISKTKNYTVWANNTELSKTSSIPWSCCRVNANKDKDDPTRNATCGIGVLDMNIKEIQKTVFTVGCIDDLIKLLEKNVMIVAGVGLAIAFVQIIGICCSCTFAFNIRRKGYDTIY